VLPFNVPAQTYQDIVDQITAAFPEQPIVPRPIPRMGDSVFYFLYTDFLVQLRDGGVAYDARNIRALTAADIVTIANTGFNINNFPASPYDVSDRAARLVGIVYGNLGQLQQRGTSLDLYAALRYSGSEIDPRSIRALTSSDVVTAQQTTRTNMTVKPEREDMTSQAAVISPSAAGVQLVAASGSTKIKVFKWGYQSTVAGQHFFYFGTSTTAPTLSATPTSKVFGVSLTAGHYRQSNSPNPDVSGAGDALYFYSASAESSMTVDYGYVQE
jgi:hypothetical protein